MAKKLKISRKEKKQMKRSNTSERQLHFEADAAPPPENDEFQDNQFPELNLEEEELSVPSL